MKVLMCYDVADEKRRRKLVKCLEKFGVRIQYSVFLGDISESQLKEINKYAERILNKDADKFYIYHSSEMCSLDKIDPLPKKYLIV